MKAEVQSVATLKELSHDRVQEGFEELENYLRSTPRSVASRHAERATEVPLASTEDVLYDGFDQLERNLKAARIDATTGC
jgi:hypothetical protein